MKIRNTKHEIRNAGFTLVELLLYMAIMVVFLGVLTNIFVSILESKKESEATSAVEQDGRFILSRLTYDVSRASSITVSGGPPPNTLSLVISGPNDVYTVTGSNLTLNTIQLNSSETKVSGLTFQKLGNPGGRQTVQIKFTVTSVTQRPSGPEVRNYQTTIGTR